jgi:hypothetical protein
MALSRWFGRSVRRPIRKTAARPLGVLNLEDRLAPAGLAINGSSFEQPALTAGTFQYAPTGTPWTFNGGAGVAANGSGFTSGNPVAPQGNQVLFVQGNSSVSQQRTFDDGSYTLSFLAAQRGNVPSAETFQVLINGVVIGTFNNLTGSNWTSLSTSSFNVANDNYTITIRGTNLNGGDNTVLIDGLTLTPQAVQVADSGFEFPAQAPNTFTYNPTGGPWIFSGGSGLASNGSAFTSGNAAAPQGNQVAVLQKLASIREAVDFVAGTYAIKFSAAQRGNMKSNETFQVLIDDHVVGTYNNLTGTSYTLQTTSSFNLNAGMHFITFKGTNLAGGDNTAFIDDVHVTSQSTGLNDSGFESLNLALGGFQYAPTGQAWTFSPGAGIASNVSGFTAGNSGAPQGSQVMFLQKTSTATQTLTTAAGTYKLGFQAAQRANVPSSQTMQVLIDGKVVGNYNNFGSQVYTALESSSITLTAGSHIVTFQGTNLAGGDNTIFVDDVTLKPQTTNLNDSGFEVPVITQGDFAYRPSGSPWTFGGDSGVAANVSGFTSGNAGAPQGNQVLFLQKSAQASQSITMSAGSYAIHFTAAQRGNLSSTQTLDVVVDNTVVGSFNNISSAMYNSYSTAIFTAPAGAHTITFRGTNLNGGDNTLLIDQVSLTQPSSIVLDGGFESPAQLPGKFAYVPTGSPWMFAGDAGISANGSAFTLANPVAPQGSQVGVLQGTGSMTQYVTLSAGTYALNFVAAQRGGQSSPQTFRVLVDGKVVSTFNSLTGSGYTMLTTSSFDLTDGTHTITYEGTNLNGGDHTVFLDGIALIKG